MKFGKTILCFLCLYAAYFFAANSAWANPADFAFIHYQIEWSNCHFDANEFSTEFSSAMDRLNEINPELVKHIRENTYLLLSPIKCDVPPGGRGIYYLSTDRTIHLWQNMSTSWRTSASFFHEFLHFVGVRVDPKFHDNPDPKTIVELDPIYACHLSVFPQLAPLVGVDASRLPAARHRCSLASVYNLNLN